MPKTETNGFWGKIPRLELMRRMSIALRMMDKIAGNKEPWTLSELRKVIAEITADCVDGLGQPVMPDYVALNMQNLKSCRISKNLTQKQLAPLVGITKEYLSSYERGEAKPRERNYNKLARFFGWRLWE